MKSPTPAPNPDPVPTPTPTKSLLSHLVKVSATECHSGGRPTTGPPPLFKIVTNQTKLTLILHHHLSQVGPGAV